jgi:hypothetical protein
LLLLVSLFQTTMCLHVLLCSLAVDRTTTTVISKVVEKEAVEVVEVEKVAEVVEDA